jgi:hypothetical protein
VSNTVEPEGSGRSPNQARPIAPTIRKTATPVATLDSTSSRFAAKASLRDQARKEGPLGQARFFGVPCAAWAARKAAKTAVPSALHHEHGADETEDGGQGRAPFFGGAADVGQGFELEFFGSFLPFQIERADRGRTFDHHTRRFTVHYEAPLGGQIGGPGCPSRPRSRKARHQADPDERGCNCR